MKIKGNFLSGYFTLACLFLGILLGLSQTASAQLTPLNIQIVNDSGLPDSNVYIMVPGASASESVTPESLFVGKNSGTNTAVALSTLPNTSSLTSTISGNTDKIYTFQVGYISSGAIYFIYNNPFTFAGGVTPSPAPGSGNGGSGYRYDYAELSFVGGTGNNDVDLTYVDKFGIPLQLEWFQGANTAQTNLVDASYVYASTKTLANLFGSYGFGNAAYSLVNAGATNGDITPGWQYNGPTSYTNFARIVSPEKANSIGSSVAPYPDATNYLNFLITNPFVLNGYSVQGTTVKGNIFATNYLYYYLGYQVSVAANTNGGWTFTMAYNHNLVPANYNLAAMGAVAGTVGTNVNIPRQYTNTISFSTPAPFLTNSVATVTNKVSGTNMIVLGYTNIVTNLCVGAFIYGAPVGTNYTTNGVAVKDTSHIGYAVEAWMIGDVLSSLNFGFAGGNYGSNSEAWYSPNIAWSSYPYGWAQPSPYNNPTNGFYDPYAGLIYYEADAYTFAFSERVTPDVGMSVSPGDTIRITILPDDRLDSPVPEAQTVTDNSITLAWKAVTGASNYLINILRPLGIPSVITNATSYTFNNLLSGAPYVMSVQAMGTNNGNPIITPARPITAITAGTYNTVTGSLVHLSVALDGVSDPFSQLKTAYVNGYGVTPTNGQININQGYPNWTASVGTNQFPVKVVDQNNNVVFDDWASFVLSQPFTDIVIHSRTNIVKGTNVIVYTTNYVLSTTMSDINFYGQLIGKTPTFAANTKYVTGQTIPLNNQNVGVVVQLLYAPIEIRKSNPLDIVSGPPSVLISNVVSSRLTGITFNFTIPNGDNYIIESSTNLMDWQTNSTGIGTGNQQSFTNTTAIPAQFYRIKLP